MGFRGRRAFKVRAEPLRSSIFAPLHDTGFPGKLGPNCDVFNHPQWAHEACPEYALPIVKDMGASYVWFKNVVNIAPYSPKLELGGVGDC